MPPVATKLPLVDPCNPDDLPPPPSQWVQEEIDIDNSKEVVIKQANEVALLNDELEEKVREIAQLKQLTAKQQSTSATAAGTIRKLQEDLSSYKDRCAEYSIKESNWDIHASKTGNLLQVEKFKSTIQTVQATPTKTTTPSHPNTIPNHLRTPTWTQT